MLVKWPPKGSGKSQGTLVMPLTEVPGIPLTGKLEGGPFNPPVRITGGTVSESFTGGESCGVTVAKKKARAVTKGTFAGTAVVLGE